MALLNDGDGISAWVSELICGLFVCNGRKLCLDGLVCLEIRDGKTSLPLSQTLNTLRTLLSDNESFEANTHGFSNSVALANVAKVDVSREGDGTWVHFPCPPALPPQLTIGPLISEY
jgi:hypothetical protein